MVNISSGVLMPDFVDIFPRKHFNKDKRKLYGENMQIFFSIQEFKWKTRSIKPSELHYAERTVTRADKFTRGKRSPGRLLKYFKGCTVATPKDVLGPQTSVWPRASTCIKSNIL